VILSKADLFARLAEGHAAGITVVTPNTRLAQALQREFDSFQTKPVWEAPDFLPFSAFVGRLYEDALYCELPAELPMLLTAVQEQWLWREAIANSRWEKELLSIDQAADQCRDAWRLAKAWRIRLGQGNEDAQAFGAWSAKYEESTRGQVDAARLPDLVSTVLKDLKKPKLLVAYAFDILPPQTQELFDACAASGIEVLEAKPARRPARAARLSFNSSKSELEAAASWARARLENRGQENRGQSPISHSGSGDTGNRALTPIFPRIGVVVPDLQQRRKEVVRVFSRVMQPAFNLPGAAKPPMPFNVSIGLALDRYPVVALALSVIEFSNNEISFEEASRLIRSPFIGGAEGEMAARARLDARLRRKLDAAVRLPKLIGHIDGCPGLRELLERVFEYCKANCSANQSPSAWARHFSALLEAAGFPGERAPDSEEFQARAKWHEALAELSGLERLSQRISFSQAINQVKKICADTLFQPETAETPIQVLGILESAGLEFDHLWVSGLTDENWPLRAAPNPFLPVALQKQAGIPEASAESSLALDRRITEGWLGAADEVLFSYFSKEEDREIAPSPLIAEIPHGAPALQEFPRYRDEVFKRKRISAIEDSKAPALAANTVRGGTRVLADQAACPFRAFARWRLNAAALETPESGLDASQRGQLLHALMKHLWGFLKNSSSLQQNLKPAIEKSADLAVKELGLEGRFAELERARLARLALEWLEVEKARAPFEVLYTEEPRTIAVAGLELSGRIDRMDKVDGGHVLIDYKTGHVTRGAWLGERPDEPQLPVYAVSAKEKVTALTYARLQPGKMCFSGYSKDKGALPKVEQARDWDGLMKTWRREAEALGAGFASGAARVDPKKGLQTCRNCDLHTLCRVFEKLNVLSETADE
jgi:ATP-dependent helicase/nuclease subunit B